MAMILIICGSFNDLKLPENDMFVIDFNKAYMLRCDNSSDYSCSILPKGNQPDFKYLTGEK